MVRTEHAPGGNQPRGNHDLPYLVVHLVVHQGDILVIADLPPRWKREYNESPLKNTISYPRTKFVFFLRSSFSYLLLQ
ncbi:hypothetical protein AcV5_003721 [Taiwanofungus camphoratus]|nr:hypothetical protein AcV5_003721 [Antrodia cinnamomea]KAI0951734.1 hypothetical protein AcV7_007749 [Antrodia cinnamomea]